MKRYLFTEIVDAVFCYTGNSIADSKYNGLMVLAKVIEENRLEIGKNIHNLRVELNYMQDCINGNVGNKVDMFSVYDNWNSRIGPESFALESSVNLVNRTVECLFEPIKTMLAPVWKVYWSEGCNTFVDVVRWLEKADKDEGKKLKEFLAK